jgi:hypothetical protein
MVSLWLLSEGEKKPDRRKERPGRITCIEVAIFKTQPTNKKGAAILMCSVRAHHTPSKKLRNRRDRMK